MVINVVQVRVRFALRTMKDSILFWGTPLQCGLLAIGLVLFAIIMDNDFLGIV
jgi:hypothetical protein